MTIRAGVEVDRIDPANWFVGMKNTSLQLMVYGENIRQADVTTDYDGVKIDSIVRLDSPNYLLVYLNLEGVKPGEMTLNFKNGKAVKKVKYELKAREKRGEERMGFTNADVLYMLMPDRFADGNPDNNDIKGMNPYKTDRSQPSLEGVLDEGGVQGHGTDCADGRDERDDNPILWRIGAPAGKTRGAERLCSNLFWTNDYP